MANRNGKSFMANVHNHLLMNEQVKKDAMMYQNVLYFLDLIDESIQESDLPLDEIVAGCIIELIHDVRLKDQPK